MVITKDTELSELVQSEEVRNIILNVDSSIKSNIEKRNSVIENEIKNGHLNEKYLIDSETTYTNSANEVIKTYEKVIEDSAALVKNITVAAIDQQKEELEELKKRIDEEIERLEGAISDLKNECSNNMSKINSANPEKDRPVTIYMTKTNHIQYYGGCSLPSSFTISYGSEAYDKGTAKSRIDRAYNQFYDPKGAISRQRSIQDKYKLKKDEVIKKIKELDNKRTSYATDSTEQEYIIIPGGHRIPKSANPNYKPSGIQVPQQSTKTPTTTPATTPTTEATTSTEPQNTINYNTLTGGDTIPIAGKEYVVQGYVDMGNGQTRTILENDKKYYYFDSNNQLQQTDSPFSHGKTVTVEGQKYKFTPTNQLGQRKTYELSDIDKSALQYHNALLDNNVSGNTLTFNGNKYKRGTVFVDTTTVNNKEYVVYKGKGERYYVDDNNNVYIDKTNPMETLLGNTELKWELVGKVSSNTGSTFEKNI